MAKTGKTAIRQKLIKVSLLPITPLILGLTFFCLIILAYQQFMADKYYPRTFVGDINISFLTEGQAIRKLESKVDQRAKGQLQFVYPQVSFEVDLATSSAGLDYSALNQVFNLSQSENFLVSLQKQFQILFFTRQIYPQVKLSLDQQMNIIETTIKKGAKNAELIFDEITTAEGSSSARIQVKEGSEGLELDKEGLEQAAADYILSGKYSEALPVKSILPKVTSEHAQKAKKALEISVNTPVKLIFENSSRVIDAKQLLTLLDLEKGQSLLDKDKTYLYLAKLSQEIDREVQEGLFDFNTRTKRVTAFKPSRQGQKMNLDQTYRILENMLAADEIKTINLPVEIIKPKIETSDINSLGIKELLGRGISNFAGSIANRIYNVGLTASKINGVLIPPGEIFSFNQTVGDISAATGFKQAYVIKEGRTVLDDGGGVCQDSTTLFRAVLNAGLPVVKRTAHAYRVGYYEQGFPPGLDATVFYPSVDFQFKNDTSAHILIQAYTQGATLYVDLYGASDGRVSSLTQPIITNQIPPPPELRQDDPTLPKGTIKQVDWTAWGATVKFNRTVTKNGETLAQETWVSNYKPWQAVYLVGTQ
ncbi:hypothetical protein A3C26_03130 [Candidatus Daviesbacteria bacterium RIFCSPHIGHO2_02_FULL_39_12]|uniref:Peptidoglycan binding domain-containing protein n=2 Tax=Candidatus Daviesiibacteriota TaxID=1752718 RepID=A0A1F5JE41_9BACT|nr:MAG: hypothetical protein A3C26_03130 [Candidatus Daviesbacteria bacterium RIFCSPHIGHO2_02_FULL_39_12]OGE71422.1 MAG: hypothetical protein A3H40_02750 [Candidatus Daviesbacteria bacterium RIFCSPLOWO2_02_FULL_38_15]